MNIKMPTDAEPVTIIEGDCLEVMKHLPKGVIDAVVTDPPYGLGSRLAGGTWGAKFSGGLEWDKGPPPSIYDITKLGKYAAVWGGNYCELPPSRGWLVWHKRDSVPTTADVELCWTNIDMNSRLVDCTIAQTNPERLGHPTQKPLKVMEFTINSLPKDVGLILDPFGGSGTTAEAAIRLGKKCIIVEREPKYVAIIRKRIALALGRDKSQLTSLLAEDA